MGESDCEDDEDDKEKNTVAGSGERGPSLEIADNPQLRRNKAADLGQEDGWQGGDAKEVGGIVGKQPLLRRP